MSVLEILRFPDVRLRTVAKPVASFDSSIQQVIDDMLETMYAEKGVGLAATQVNIHQQIIVIDISDDRNQQLVFVNPELLEKRGETGIEEGCLSISGYRSLVPRAEWLHIRAMNRYGEMFEMESDGLLAICLQHEMDHLLGKLFIDYLPPLKPEMLKMDNRRYEQVPGVKFEVQ